MTKSPPAVVARALRVARDALPEYSARTSRKDFTQPQHFAILALKTFLKTDYRGVVAFLKDFAELRDALGLAKVPRYSTLCKAGQRLLKKGGSEGFCGTCSPAPTKAA
jgi:hypothetical protein